MLRVATAAALHLLVGCALLQPPQGDALEQKVNTLIAEKRYGEAQQLLAKIPRDSADYKRFASRRKQVDNLAAQYERKVVEDARQLMLQERWAEALDLYDQALENMPHSTKLREGQADLKRLQQQRLARQESDLLINRGERLLVALPAYQNLTRIDPRDSRREWEYQNKKREGELLAEELVEAGDKALDYGDYEQAERTILLAARLSDKAEVRQGQQRLEQARSKRARDLRSLQEQRLRNEIPQEQNRSDTVAQLQRDYESAVQQRDLLTARSQLAKLRAYAPEIVAQRGYERELKREIENETERLYDEGVSHYGHSEFEKARDSWQMVLALEPGHRQAKESLARVNKVLHRVEHLRKKQKRD